jgi:tetratricopeptide (TPR) repeat protein
LPQAVALDPNSFNEQFYLGCEQYAAYDFQGAAKSLRAAVKLNPRHAEARFFFGTVLKATGAIEEYGRAIRSINIQRRAA